MKRVIIKTVLKTVLGSIGVLINIVKNIRKWKSKKMGKRFINYISILIRKTIIKMKSLNELIRSTLVTENYNNN